MAIDGGIDLEPDKDRGEGKSTSSEEDAVVVAHPCERGAFVEDALSGAGWSNESWTSGPNR